MAFIPETVLTAEALNAAFAEKATPADIDAAIAALVGGSSAALDTLSELAQALGDDENFAATVAQQLSGKQATLVAGENIKTINGESLLGGSDIKLTTMAQAFYFGNI